jgi:hypothetical protein
MAELQVHLLRFRAEVIAPLRLPPTVGAALRGALFRTLQQQFCLAGRGPGCGQAPLAADCPVCFLLAPVDETDRRGRDVPRPYVLRPPLSGPRDYAVGQIFEFELATFGRALGHFPYTLLGIEEMGRAGVGAGRQGAFRLDEVWAVNPLQGRQEAVYVRSRGATVRTPSLPVGETDVREEAAALAGRGGTERLRIELEAPMRLVEGGKLVKPEGFAFRAFFARLLERLTALRARYGDGAPPPDVPALLGTAGEVRIAERRLEWRELFRGSARHRRALPMGGLLGGVTVDGELAPLLPWLVWGTLTHVGKDAAMGNGRYRLEVG